MKRKCMALFTVTLIYVCSQLFFGCTGRVPKESGDESSYPGSISNNIESEDFTLEEIMITSEKMEAELQKVPISICILRPDDMRRMNASQMSELQKILPNLISDDCWDAPCILALGSGYFSPYFGGTPRDVDEITVSASICGVKLTRPNIRSDTRSNAMEDKFYDLERVEMRKRPWETLQ